MSAPRILYCHCQYAQVLPKEVKTAVLEALCQSDIEFEAVPDLCELSSKKDPILVKLAQQQPVKIAACFPRAVKWLFAAANAPLNPLTTEVVNLRNITAADAIANILAPEFTPNLPQKSVSP